MTVGVTRDAQPGALANPLVEYLPRAVTAGAVLQPDSYVTRVLTGP